MANSPSVEPSVRSRLLPRISFRAILGLVTAAAGIFWLLRQSLAGSQFLAAVAMGLAFVAVVGGLSMLLFVIAWVPAWLGRDKWADVNRGNPFAADQLPPQILPPRNPPQ